MRPGTNEALEAAVVIYMDDFRKARAVKLPGLCREEELLCVNWNPAFSVIALSCYQTPQELSPQLPDERADMKPGFMNRVSALASQI
jgi:hypothetical protein